MWTFIEFYYMHKVEMKLNPCYLFNFNQNLYIYIK